MSCFPQTPGGDISIVGGQVVLVTDPIAAGAIKLTNRFKLWVGEWFRDARIGLPYLTQILVKNPDLGLIQQMFTQVVTTTPPFVDVQDLVVSPPTSARVANVSFTAIVDPNVLAGATVTWTSLSEPFVIDIPGATGGTS